MGLATVTAGEGNTDDLVGIAENSDWNRRPGGTAGCVGIHSVSDFKRLVSWLRDTDPRSLYVDWRLGTCPDPKAPEATSDEAPCAW